LLLNARILCVLLLAAAAIPAGAKDEGFSGKWVLDRNQDAPEAPKNLETRIKQDGSGLTMESTFREPDNGIVPLLYLGIMTSRVHVSLDGTPAQNQIGPFQMAAKSTLDGKQMNTDWTAEVKGDQVHGHWTHTLSDDGKHMTLQIKENSAQGQNAEATLHFVRK